MSNAATPALPSAVDDPNHWEKLRRRRHMRSADYALELLITDALTPGSKTRTELVRLGKADAYTPDDVRNGIDRLCRVGTATHDTNENGLIVVRLRWAEEMV